MGSFNSGASVNNIKYSVEDVNIQSQKYVTNTSSTNYGESGYGTEQVDYVSFEINDDTSNNNPIDAVHEEIAQKTVVEDREATGDEIFIAGHITKYSDGTEVLTDVNQIFYKNTVEYITIPLEDGSGVRQILIMESNDEGLLCIDSINIGHKSDDGSSSSVSYDVTRYYEGRNDGLVKRIDNPQNADYNSVAYYEGRSDGIVCVEQYLDKSIYYYEDGRQEVR